MSKVTLSDFIISVVELIEAQIDEIKISFENSAKGLILLFVSALLLFTGIIFLLLGIKVAIEFYLGEVFAYILTAFITLFTSFIIMKVASWKTQHKK